MLVAMGSRVLYSARAPKPDAVGEYRSFNALLAESDVISLHVPLTPDTDLDAGGDGKSGALQRPGAEARRGRRISVVQCPARGVGRDFAACAADAGHRSRCWWRWEVGCSTAPGRRSPTRSENIGRSMPCSRSRT